ncbi:MAG: ACP S-malonyltransferase [Myxococcales bacterium]
MKFAWLFPGQGAQTVGMADSILEVSPAARDVFRRADEALGEPLSELVHSGPEERLTLTANAQPAILATSLAFLAALREGFPDFPEPAFAAGHSLGEYSALVAAGALTLEDAVRLVRIRGTAMQEAVPAGVGAMSAIVGLEASVVEAICTEVSLAGEGMCSPANYNAPGQLVIAGHAEAVARASERVAASGGRAMPLKVSAPFHSSLMAPVARVLDTALARTSVGPLRFPVVANVDATPNAEAASVRGLLVAQVDAPVRWEATIRFLVAQGVTHALEIGPGKVLSGLSRRIAKELRVLSVNDVVSLAQTITFLGA